MTTTIPPPPKHGGSGPFIVAAVAMLLLMGGLIYWKLSDDDTKPPPQASVAATTAPPMLEEAPPPPPPPAEAVKDAGVPPKQPTKRILATIGGCDSECAGTEAPALRSQLQGKAAMTRGCYERALRQNAHLQGRMKVSLRIGPNGSVCFANVTRNDLGDPGVATCVLQIFRSATFASPQGGCVNAEVPLNFEPKT